MPFQKGTVFTTIINKQTRHKTTFFVISNPHPGDNTVLAVPAVKQKENFTQEQICKISNEEHTKIIGKKVIDYYNAITPNVDILQRRFESNELLEDEYEHFEINENCNEGLLKKLQEKALLSEHINPDYIKKYKDYF